MEPRASRPAIDLNKDLRLVVLPFGSMPAALERGVVDAASMIEPFMTQLSQRRKVRVIAPVRYALENSPVSFGVVRRDYAKEHADAVKRFRAAWFDAVRWIRSNPDESAIAFPRATARRSSADCSSRSGSSVTPTRIPISYRAA